MLPFLFGKREKPQKKASDKELRKLVEQELSTRNYLSKEDLDEYLAKIKEDDRKRKLWESLSPRQQLKVLRYAKSKKGENGKKQLPQQSKTSKGRRE